MCRIDANVLLAPEPCMYNVCVKQQCEEDSDV